jgi:hypothetical protein
MASLMFETIWSLTCLGRHLPSFKRLMLSRNRCEINKNEYFYKKKDKKDGVLLKIGRRNDDFFF